MSSGMSKKDQLIRAIKNAKYHLESMSGKDKISHALWNIETALRIIKECDIKKKVK